MANYLVTDTELTNVANSIRTKGNTTASLNWPTGYISAVNNISSDAYAMIGVTYPAGSVCTATNGTKTLTAKDTSGKVTFSIPTPANTPETWTINCSNSSTGDSASMNISISSYGQSFVKELIYIKPVLNNNSWATISKVAKAGTGDTYWDVGDRKAITLNGKIGNYLTLSNYATYVFILDFNHPVNKSTADKNIIFGGFKTALSGGKDVCLCDSGYKNAKTSGIYFNMNHKQATTSSNQNTNYGGWRGCDFRYDILGTVDTAPVEYNASRTSYATGSDATTKAITSPKANTLMAALPSDFRSVLRLWTRWINNTGGDDAWIDTSVSACIDAGISLLAEFEIFGARTKANNYEQNH